MKNKPLPAGRKAYVGIMRTLMLLCTLLTVALVLFMIGYIMYRGIPNITWKLVSTKPSALYGNIGILPDILNTLYIVAATLAVVIPLGVGAAIYLTEYAKSKRIVAAVEYAAETLSGIPSIIYGLVGMLFFCQFFGMKTSLMAGALTLVIMNLRDAHDPGEPEDRAAELPRGRFRTRRGQVARDPHGRTSRMR